MASSLYTTSDTQVFHAADADRVVKALMALQDLGSVSTFGQIAAPSTAPTVAAASGSGSLTGTYLYGVTFVTGIIDGGGSLHIAGETPPGPTASITLSTQNTSLTNIPIGPTGTVARRIVRTTAGGATLYQDILIADNTTTAWTDSTADGSLGPQASAANTTGTTWLFNALVTAAQGLALPSATPKTGAGVLSQEGGTLYLGDGTVANPVTPPAATTTSPGVVEIAAAPSSGAPEAIIANPGSVQTMSGSMTVSGTLSVSGLINASGNLGLPSQTPSVTAGVLSQEGNQLYIGNGSAAQPVGSNPITNPLTYALAG